MVGGTSIIVLGVVLVKKKIMEGEKNREFIQIYRVWGRR
jgi:hypothetical protein